MERSYRGSFTIPAIQEMLHISKVTAYEISKIPELDRQMVAGSYRIKKDIFWQWYDGQTKYKVYEISFDPDDYFTSKDVREMLGISERSFYRLLDCNGLRADVSTRKIYIRKDVFTEWYLSQIRFVSDDPRLPKKEISESYSISDIKRILRVESRSTIYNIYKRKHLDLIRLDGQTRVVKESFDRWFESQCFYPRKQRKE